MPLVADEYEVRAEVRIRSLARSFHALANHPHVITWDACALDRSVRGMSNAEKLVVRFILSVWNPWEKWKCGKFDVVEASTCWDADHWAAFQAWANNPFTC